MQRHHLVPRQALGMAAFARMFARLGDAALGYDDFRRNGLLLPAREGAALRLALPLHRGPHRSYNEMVIERLGQIEADWSRRRGRHPARARFRALQRISALQNSLRRQLLDERVPMVLNRRDPVGRGRDFALLDSLADQLWAGSES